MKENENLKDNAEELEELKIFNEKMKKSVREWVNTILVKIIVLIILGICICILKI